jgi:hypothetical protein
MALRGDGVLIRFDGARGVENVGCGMVLCRRDGRKQGEQGRAISVDCRHDGEVVLKLEEFVLWCWGYSDRGVERVRK